MAGGPDGRDVQATARQDTKTSAVKTRWRNIDGPKFQSNKRCSKTTSTDLCCGFVFLHLAFPRKSSLAGNQPRPAVIGEILEPPLDEYENAVLKLDDVHQVNEEPHEPRNQAVQV